MRYNVLIVEDDPMVLLINQRYVERVPNFVIQATAQTLSHAQNILLTDSIDLVLIDINLKNESGISLVKWIRSEDIAVEFIIISAENQAKTVEVAASYGAIDYILKPFKFERFKQSLAQFTKKADLIYQRDSFDQDDLDKLYWNNPQSISIEDQSLEKGISRNTLMHVIGMIRQINKAFSIEEITDQAGLSHVTVRKYIQYLLKKEILTSEMVYGDIGRPTALYKLND